MKFKEDGIGASDLIKLIPDELLLDLAAETNVDYQVKKLYGRNVFNLLLFGLLENERIGLRSLEDFYNSRKFRALFKLPGTMPTAKFNSFSARLAKMNVDFFSKAYEAIYEQCSHLYDESTLSLHYKITRVDSTMVCQTAAKLEEGMNVGMKKNGKKQVKYTVSLTNMFPSSVEVYTKQKHLSENQTIPQAILKLVDKSKDNIFVFDRGVSKRKAFCELDQNDFLFVTRLKVDSRYIVLNDMDTSLGIVVRNLTVLKDQRVYLYRSGDHVVENEFRLIQTQDEKGRQFWFLTNHFDLKCKEIIEIYKHRWDIEVFFRFLKQELNFAHLISVNVNGIKILLYMTLILAMLILIYKKINGFGYKTAKRRFAMELEYMIDDYMIIQSGGDPNTFFR
ncbi:MAG: IS4 family transposase [Bacteroidetes bacterium]|nr:IS4 family transposase [Bacteroidota bacterium]